MPEHPRAPVGVDPSKPNAARIYNYMLGGKDNYEIDQLVAHRMLAVAPDTRTMAWFSRQFMLRCVQFTAEQGIRQFIDIGAGIPISPNAHEVARKIQPTALVASVDYDPVVDAHAHAAFSAAPGVTPILADVRRPVELIERCHTEAGIDWSEPVAILLVGVMHYVMDDEGPDDIFARLRDAMAPGSYLALTHGWDESARDFMAQSTNDTFGSSAQIRFRSETEVARLCEGFELMEPGLVPIQQWLDENLPVTRLALLSAVCRKK
ncbi:SAM-dependent methyltransferase [Nocardia arthritidis]|uniref:SAM-dependent methyltransferase n=1 Tax=Nocardia arthritidis TaxID=228602 RepID=A0A6G9YUI2_9NOCA|nr:SAM-dependent methyltransferase [Nocardia arthritidis]QIS16810.1 SAM-dependent methyltransferase [Nocardia arthritidis]